MFENFMAFNDTPVEKTDKQGAAIYLVIFNDKGYQEAINWLDNDEETYKLLAKESSYYAWNFDDDIYEPLYGVNGIPQELIDCFNEHRDTKDINISTAPELYTVKLYLSDGTIIKPNYQSDNMLDFASIIEQLLTDKLFNGQVKKIIID